jgi:hypothetical protein
MDTTCTRVHRTRVCALGDLAPGEATIFNVQPAIVDLGSAAVTGRLP